MALIKCKNCGRTISDKALRCPHCGYNQKEALNSKEAVETPTIESEEEQVNIIDKNGQQANKALLILVIILSIIAIGLGGYLIGGGRFQRADSALSDSTAIDSLTVDTITSDTTVINPITNDTDLADTIISPSNDYNDEDQIEEIGFKSNSDIMDFVVGNTYSHDGITLRITDEAVYANDNKISTSKPVFRKISLNKGVITARPSISITVIRDDNRLVDNNNGDTYYY